jgi:hypothetical protein
VNDHEELAKSIKKLLALLRNIMKQGGSSSHSPFPPELQNMLNDSAKNIQLNLCMFTFLPIDPVDLEDFQDVLEGQLHGESGLCDAGSLSFEITPSDIDFLKEHGIKF